MIDRPTDRAIDSLTPRSIDRPTKRLSRQSIGRPADRRPTLFLLDRSADRSIDFLTDRRPIDRPIDQSTLYCSID
jgi:hypothetical protein